jgi:hypothetical protein
MRGDDYISGGPFAVLSDDQLDAVSKGHCPACGSRGFVIGPAAPAGTVLNLNIECAMLDCRSRYNIAFVSGQAIHGHDLFDGRAGPPWPSEPSSA